MDDAEKKAMEEYAKAGVDLPELKDVPKEEPKEPEAPLKEEPKEPEEPKDPLQDTPKEPRKRSIYDVYKEEKSERKTAEARAEQAEKDRDELARKLEEATAGKGTEDDKDTAADDAIAYAKKVGADPDLVKRIIEDARRGYETNTDPDVVKRLDRFEAWEKSNAKTMETTLFNEEFTQTLPQLKELFPAASDEEMSAIKTELDALSHKKEWHDKSLDYVAFKNRTELSALVSPKKKGMERKGRQDAADSSFDFNPEADYSKMTAAEKKLWEKAYNESMKSEGLITDGQGRKLII